MFVIDDGTSTRCPPTSASTTNQTKNLVYEQEGQSQIDTICSWRPVAVVVEYKKNPTDPKNQWTFFHHITNFVAMQESGNNKNLVPADYLNVDMNSDQDELLKPSQKSVMMGSILKDAAGKGARQLIAKRQIDMIDGNIGSYSRQLNSTARIEMIRDVNALADAVPVISKEKVVIL